MQTLLDYSPMVLAGLGTTVSLALCSLSIAILLGALGASLKLSRNPVAKAIGNGYTALVRGVPDLVLMLIVYFGGQTLVNTVGYETGLWDYVEISAFWAGTGTIGLIFGAYMTETFRGAFNALDRGQIEAAHAVGMTRFQTFAYVIWPQIVPLALPSFTNNWLVLLKTTALVSIIGLQDVMYNANQAGRSSQEPFLFLLLAFAIYLGLTLISDGALKAMAARYRSR